MNLICAIYLKCHEFKKIQTIDANIILEQKLLILKYKQNILLIGIKKNENRMNIVIF